MFNGRTQPITTFSNALRNLTLGGGEAVGVGHSTTYWVAWSLMWCASILVVFGSIAVAKFARRRSPVDRSADG